MFKKTRLRLVVLNSIVFFLLLNGFGATLYFYMQYRLYHEADQTLTAQAAHLEHENFRDLSHPPMRGHDESSEELRRIVYLLWDTQGQVAELIPQSAVSAEDEQLLQPTLSCKQIQTVTLGSTDYRVYNLPVKLGQWQADPMGNLQMDSISTVQMIYSMGPEQAMLKSLLLIIVVADIISAVVAVVAGFFLANRALIPIQLAWEKQQEFVADASHELRTPLAVMKTHLERLFRHPEHTIEQESDNISDAILETRRMSKLVVQLLTLARSDSNELELLQQKLRLDEILERTVQQFRQLAVLKDIEITTAIDSPVELTGDEERLQQLFVILLDNALKYTQEQGKITVSCHRTVNTVNLVVADTGVGISKEDLPHIFDRFFRGDKARTRTQEGTGLGLSIARWIVEAHGGKIRAESELERGTTILISLPMRVRG